ncbi:hypothetical protein [Streptomyces zaomyceticus]|uniref:hypothetical protein n=1 Tax=Streptomyces zaomyceticus TaxID=68286 RepID=UPI0034472ECB
MELPELVRRPDPVGLARRHPPQVSGGTAQRAGIALALALIPRPLIADEPTTALDVTVQGEIPDLLLSLRQDKGMALVLVTHGGGAEAVHSPCRLCPEAAAVAARGTTKPPPTSSGRPPGDVLLHLTTKDAGGPPAGFVVHQPPPVPAPALTPLAGAGGWCPVTSGTPTFMARPLPHMPPQSAGDRFHVGPEAGGPQGEAR